MVTEAVPARWATGDDLPATVRVMPSAGATTDGSVALQTLAAASPAPIAQAGPGPAPGRNEIVFPPRDDAGSTAGSTAGSAAGASPGAWSAMGLDVQRLAAFPATSGAAPTRPGGTASTPTAQLALARPPAPAAAASSLTAYPTHVAAPAGRVVAEPVASPVVAQASRQGSSPGSSESAAGIAASPVVQRVDGAAPSPPDATGEGHSDAELDELARALFGRIRTQLRADVIHDREARGLTFDAF